MVAQSSYYNYKEKIMELINSIDINQILKGAELLKDTISRDALIYVVGTEGHDYMMVEEMFLKPGGLVNIFPIFPSGIALAHGGTRSNIISRCQGYMKGVIDYYAPFKEDALVIVSTSGVNSLAIEAALYGKKQGGKIIAITSSDFSSSISKDNPSRDTSKLNLCDLEQVDVLIDSKIPFGDAILNFTELKTNVSSVSTILNSFILNELVAITVEKSISEGIIPAVWRDCNYSDADQFNKKYMKKYSDRIKRF
jgi:uncharacterized phosphosugar-binding protein